MCKKWAPGKRSSSSAPLSRLHNTSPPSHPASHPLHCSALLQRVSQRKGECRPRHTKTRAHNSQRTSNMNASLTTHNNNTATRYGPKNIFFWDRTEWVQRMVQSCSCTENKSTKLHSIPKTRRVYIWVFPFCGTLVCRCESTTTDFILRHAAFSVLVFSGKPANQLSVKMCFYSHVCVCVQVDHQTFAYLSCKWSLLNTKSADVLKKYWHLILCFTQPLLLKTEHSPRSAAS